ncbi:flagellar basal body P-ring formation chaperone FlgA [Variovorax sp. ZT4R33]|uniref:flagellar basal body P-ring formation chaperone FlgA n=1 Tax=Variovorax sp. ZT4R33 TaxID=3443743 RepID=UPI003F46BB00
MTPCHLLRRSLPALLAALAPLLGPTAAGATEALPAAAMAAIEQLVARQTSGMPGKASVSANLPGTGTLPACDAYDAFLPTGAAPRGRVSVGLRCRTGAPWTRFVPAYVKVEGSYYVASRTIEPGDSLGPADLTQQTGDLAALPRSVVTHGGELLGVRATGRIAAGAPLRKELLRAPTVIQQGQTVQVVAQGAGFTVSTEARALAQAAAGGVARAKTLDGRMVTGVADEDGQIVLSQ